MPKPSEVIVLAEDARHQSLVRRYLYRAGFGRHQITFAPLPSGRGCGEQWVRERYAHEVRAFRRRSSKKVIALVVAIDADKLEVAQRAGQLRSALQAEDLAPRTPIERIAHLIPKRNVETWLLCLTGEAVDEDSDYKRDDLDALAIKSAEALFSWSRDNAQAPPHCIPSLRLALTEIRRVDAP